MSVNSPSSDRYHVVSEANRLQYGRPGAAEQYDKTHFLGEHDLEVLDADLKRALDKLGHPARRAAALDACGGTGNAALRLQAMGCDTHLVDISEEMVRYYRKQCEARGYPASAEAGEILSFFAGNTRKFDLIVFSSALHHLEDPVLVLRHAQAALTPGGLIVTIFDPVKATRVERLLLEPVRLLDRALAEPKQVFGGFARVLRRVLRGGARYKHEHTDRLVLSDDNVGSIAEFHGDEGMDDFALAKEIESSTKLRVLRHDRHRAPWGVVMPYARMLLRKPTNFRFLLQNTATA
jgi:ubiquinone/menaquinone biosynthesis C-methylase UbiE